MTLRQKKLYRIFPTAEEKATEDTYAYITSIKNKGLGVRAKIKIAKGKQVAVFPGWVIDGDTSTYAWNQYRLLSDGTVKEDVSIDVADPNTQVVDPQFAHYIGPRVNEPDAGKSPNLEVVYNFTKNPPTVEYWSARTIKKGEELTVCYGNSYEPFRHGYVGCEQVAKYLYTINRKKLDDKAPPGKLLASWMKGMTRTPNKPPVNIMPNETNSPIHDKRQRKPRRNDNFEFNMSRVLSTTTSQPKKLRFQPTSNLSATQLKNVVPLYPGLSASNSNFNLPASSIHAPLTQFANTLNASRLPLPAEMLEYLRSQSAKRAWYVMVAIGKKIDEGKIVDKIRTKQHGSAATPGRKVATLLPLIVGFLFRARQYVEYHHRKSLSLDVAVGTARALVPLALMLSPTLARTLKLVNESSLRKQSRSMYGQTWTDVRVGNPLPTFQFNARL